MSGLDCALKIVIKNCEFEVPYISVGLFNLYLKQFYFANYLNMLGATWAVALDIVPRVFGKI